MRHFLVPQTLLWFNPMYLLEREAGHLAVTRQILEMFLEAR